MKKETTNTFSSGLNYDLNPITTPNNVLTDCVNGTTITYNGDELALQNDSGNSRILVSGTNEYVQLSDGFYPLGIKEHGGVLYIISSNGTNVEFGSYPSPERADNVGKGIIDSIFDETLDTETLISGTVKFQAGVDVKFTHLETDSYNKAYITTYDSNGDKVSPRKLYDVKLYHRLGSGLIDLTSYVNKKSASLNKLWFENNNITYKCYNNYKGILLTKVELEKINKFKLSQDPVYNKNTGTLTFYFDIDSGCSVVIKGFNISYTLDDGDSINVAPINFSDLSITDGIYTYVLNIGSTTSDRVINYKIVPRFTYFNLDIWLNIEQPIDYSEIPDYVDNYTITGNKLLSSKEIVYKLVPTTSASLCNVLGNSGMTIFEWTLQDNDGNYLDNNLNITTTDIYGFVDIESRDNWTTLFPTITKPTFHTTKLLGSYDYSTTYIGDGLITYLNDSTTYPTVSTEIIYDLGARVQYITSSLCNSTISNVINLTKSGNSIVIQSEHAVTSSITVGLRINLSSTITYVTLPINSISTTYDYGLPLGSAYITSLSVTVDDTYTYVIGNSIEQTVNYISTLLDTDQKTLTVTSTYTVTSVITVTVDVTLTSGLHKLQQVILNIGSSSSTYVFDETIEDRFIKSISPSSDWNYSYKKEELVWP